jgi:shikimate dehydrogenase
VLTTGGEEEEDLRMLRPREVTGRTLIIPLIGHPVEQVQTPGPMNHWFNEHEIDAVVVPMDIRPERVGSYFDLLKAVENLVGCTITMPHKQAAFAAADEVSERARRARAVNIIRRSQSGRLVGDMTDGIAMVAALKDNDVSIHGGNVLIVGAGGAGTAIAHAVAEEGAASLTIVERDQMRHRALLADLARFYPSVAVSDRMPADRAIDIAINASPAGMQPDDPHPFPLEQLDSAIIFADAVTKPAVTPWLTEAARRGKKIQAGEEMALAQVSILLHYLRFLPHPLKTESGLDIAPGETVRREKLRAS